MNRRAVELFRVILLCCAAGFATVLTPVAARGRDRNCTSSPACSCQYNVTEHVKLIVQCQKPELSDVPVLLDSNVRVMKLEHTAVAAVNRAAFVRAPNLHTLRLSFNKIASIEDDAFVNLDRLMYLSLAGNQLSSINETTFKHLSSLTVLSLSSNPIWYIRRNAFIFVPNLTGLLLVDTQILCGCNPMLALQAFTVSGMNFSQLSTCSGKSKQQSPVISSTELSLSERREDCSGTDMESHSGARFCSARYGNEASASLPGVERCNNSQSTCLTIVSVRNWVKTRQDECISEATCRLLLLDNPTQCFHNTPDSECKLCCATGSICNADVYSWNDRTSTGTRNTITNLFMLNVSRRNEVPDENRIRERFQQNVTRLAVRPENVTLKVIDSRPLGSNGTAIVILVTTSTSLFIGQAGLSLLYAAALAAATNHNTAHVSPICLGYELGSDSCPPSVTKSRIGYTEWPRTLVGRSSRVPCPFSFGDNSSFIPVAIRSCSCGSNGSISWDDPIEIDCQITPENALNATKQLAWLLEDSLAHPSDTRLENAIDLLVDGIASTPNISRGMSTTILNSMSMLFTANVERMALAEKGRSSATSIVNGLAALAANIHIANGDSIIIHADNIVVAAKIIDSGHFKGLNFSMDSINPISDPYHDQGAEAAMTVQVSLKPSLITQVKAENGNASTDRAYFVIQKKDTMFQAIQLGKSMQSPSLENASETSLKNEKNAPSIDFTGSYIVNIGLAGMSVQNLTDPVVISLPQTVKASSTSFKCAYWDEKSLAWSHLGVTTSNSLGNTTTCYSTHLTNFALLMSVDSTELSEPVQSALSYISLIGCAISLVSVIITLAVTLTRRRLSHDNPGKILVNLCFALALTNLAFLSLTHFTDGVICQVSAALLHFFVLAAFMWMLIEAFHMYLSFVVVFGTHYSRFMLKAGAAGWGVPLVIVAVTVSIDRSNYGSSSSGASNGDGLCWLTGNALYGAFHAPVALILLANCFVFAMVLKRLLATRQSLREDKETRLNMAKQLRATSSLVVLLGLTWLIGFFAIGRAKAAFSVLFVVFNSLQGFFIFVFYCAMRPDVQRTWYPRLCPCLPPLPDKSFATASMTSSGVTSTSIKSHRRLESRKNGGPGHGASVIARAGSLAGKTAPSVMQREANFSSV